MEGATSMKTETEAGETRLPRTHSPVEIRRPSASDAAAVWDLVQATPSLDGNSPYAYLLLCSHFADTGLVAYRDDELAGFLLGYARPDVGSTAFVWQVAVAESARGQRLGSRLLDTWFARCARRSDLRHLEATVTPSNQPSRALFESFAERHGAPLREGVAFHSALFPEEVPHEDELLVRIGPISLSKAFAPVTPARESKRDGGSSRD